MKHIAYALSWLIVSIPVVLASVALGLLIAGALRLLGGSL